MVCGVFCPTHGFHCNSVRSLYNFRLKIPPLCLIGLGFKYNASILLHEYYKILDNPLEL